MIELDPFNDFFFVFVLSKFAAVSNLARVFVLFVAKVAIALTIAGRDQHQSEDDSLKYIIQIVSWIWASKIS
jgi:hypothetical protein